MKRSLALTGSVTLVALGLGAGLVTSDVAAEGGPAPKVFVCKYVGTPGPGERLQTGDNPIDVSANSIKAWNGANPGNLIGLEFADAQGFSRVIAIDVGQPEPSCPGLPPLNEEVTPTAPTFRDPTCELGAHITLPVVEGVEYAVAGAVEPGHEVKVTASPEEGYVFPDGATTEWEHTFGSVPDNCVIPPTDVAATAPTFRDPTCDAGAALELPTVTGVTYAVEGIVGPGREVTVTAEAEEGSALKGTDEWKHTYGTVPDNCTAPPGPPIQVTPAVAFRDPTCDAAAAVVPTTTTGLTYTVAGTVAPGGTVTVSASANDGYTIVGNDTWTHTFGQVPSNCSTATTPATPTTPAPPTTPTTPTTPTAPLTPPATTPVATKPAVKKPAAKPSPAPPRKAVAGAFATEPPKLAYTP